MDLRLRGLAWIRKAQSREPSKAQRLLWMNRLENSRKSWPIRCRPLSDVLHDGNVDDAPKLCSGTMPSVFPWSPSPSRHGAVWCWKRRHQHRWRNEKGTDKSKPPADQDRTQSLNLQSLEHLSGCLVEPSLRSTSVELPVLFPAADHMDIGQGTMYIIPPGCCADSSHDSSKYQEDKATSKLLASHPCLK